MILGQVTRLPSAAVERDPSPEDELPTHVLEAAIEERDYAAGDVLLREGEAERSLLLIREGSVEICTTDPGGRTHRIDRAEPGQVLGEMALLTDEPRSASAIAITPVRARVLPADAFHRLARSNPELSIALTLLVAKRLGRPGRDALTDKVVDQFRIVRRLGRGAMAVVYQAEDLSSGERVALKMMSHRLVYDSESLAGFQTEADIIESFRHRNIVRMLGRFSAFHTYFIVMEFCAGQTLAELLEIEGALSEERFRSIMGQLAAAIEYAHRARIIHRDIKPANIMLTPDGTVKLMDFGLAEPPLASPPSKRQVVGTPRYMAPEQRSGQPLGPEADYFALGCVAYELLTGAPLFDHQPREELARRFANWSPPSMGKLRPDLPDRVIDALRPALNVLPGDRQLDLVAIAEWADE